MGLITISSVKKFLVKIEKKLVERMTYPPGISPQSAWFYYKLIHILLTLLAIAFIPVIGVPALLIQMFDYTGSLEFLIPVLMVMFFSIMAYLMFELNYFRCPRCSKRFEKKRPWELNTLNTVCGHCGLLKWKEPDNGKTIPQSKPVENSNRTLNINHFIRIVLRIAAALWIIFIILVYNFRNY